MKKILVVCDVRCWVFANIFNALKKNIEEFEFYDCYITENTVINHKNFDIILFLCDYKVELIKKNLIPKEKTILAIRSNVNKPFYDDEENVSSIAEIIAVSNLNLEKRFKKMHNNVVLAPGGVDTDFFYFNPKIFKKEMRIGWAGSKLNFGSKFRGIEIIESVCKKMQLEFVPAFKEDKLRNRNEMLLYYHNEIDVYVDMSLEAGRQNGLLEAASCGVPIISTKVGVAEQLITNEISGLLCDRNVEDLKKCLTKIQEINNFCVVKMYEEIKKQWSWKVQSEIFRKMFKSL
jgi:glycosyltransferase involved in cell wall biosynthesis